jgi:hypothetical protein
MQKIEVAWNTSLLTEEVLIGLSNTDDSERVVHRGSYTPTTQAASLDVAGFTNSGAKIYLMKASGNTQSNEVQVQFIYRGSASALSLSLVNDSTGLGSAGRFVARLRQNRISNNLNGTTPFFFCIASTAKAAQFETFFNSNAGNNFVDSLNGLYGNEADSAALEMSEAASFLTAECSQESILRLAGLADLSLADISTVKADYQPGTIVP